MRRVLTAITVLACAATSATAAFNFVSLGDWGCMPIGGQRAQNELTVAKTFMQSTSSLNARFILNPGDNFYYCGVHNKTDPFWESTFEGVFTDQSTMVPWYSALGNHDYGYPGSAPAQMEYVSPNNNRWVMPSRYYSKRLVFPGEVNISLIVLDASPCQQMYIGDDPSKYDPCGTKIPGCPGCTFHENVVAQSCAKQLAWLKEALTQVPADDWKIAMVHAPGSEIDVEDLVTPLQQANFDLVVNGHVHLLAHYTMDNSGTWITSGAGCMVNVDERKGGNPFLGATSCRDNSFHTCQIVWQETVAGFATHSFNDDFTELTTQMVDFKGNVLHTAKTQKGNKPVTGVPTPAPSEHNSCCYYSDSYCYAGMTCCSESGESYSKDACEGEYGQAHNCVWDSWKSKCVVG